MSWYLADNGFLDVENWVGIRSDEPKRFHMEGVAYEKNKDGSIKYYKRTGEPKRVNKIVNEDKYLPLRHAGIAKGDIINFWKDKYINDQTGRVVSKEDFVKNLDHMVNHYEDFSPHNWVLVC